MDLDVKCSPTQLSLLVKLAMHVLGCSASAALDCLHHRTHGLTQDSMHADEILSMDEAARTGDEHDRDELLKVQTCHEERRIDLDAFKKAFIAQSSAISGGEAAARRRDKPAYKVPTQLEPLGSAHTPQNTIKSFFPPHSYVWRNRRADTWNAR